MKKSNMFYKTVMTILIIIILFSLYKIGSILYGYYQGNQQYDEVRKIAGVETEEADPDKIDFDALQEANEDVKAWIFLEGTTINYPIMQTTNNDYYLYHMFNREENGAGSIFIDYRNKKPFEEFNTVLHGHRMKDGSMFKPLVQYDDVEFYENHKVIEITTPEGAYNCEVFAALTVPATSDYYRFEFYDEEDRMDYLNRIREESVLDTSITVGTDDRIVIMSTCTAQLDENRFCVFGKLVEAE